MHVYIDYMQKLIFLLVLFLVTSCGQSFPSNCASLPAGFHYANDPHFWDGKAVGITPPLIHEIKVERSGKVKWNGADIDYEYAASSLLRNYLGEVAVMIPQPFITLDFDSGAPCKIIQRVRVLMEKHLDCQKSSVCLQGQAPF